MQTTNRSKRISINSLCCIVFSLTIALPGLTQQVPSSQAQATKSRELKIAKGQKYLNFPVKTGGKNVLARIKVDGKILDQFTFALADEQPDFWTFFDVSSYVGKKVIVEIEKAPVFSRGPVVENQIADVQLSDKGLNKIFADARFPGQDSVYVERDRPQVHFSAMRGWLNDPNGLVYDDSEYHLYFQHNPYGWAWGNMHWGHAVSPDLIHWTELPEAIYPMVSVDTKGGRPDAAFSGSAFMDPGNTGGFRKNGVDPLLVMYTSTGRGECLKISYDKGRTFIDYEGNPILKHNGRDPKVFWYEKGKHWVMVVWDAGMPKKMGDKEVLVRQHSIYTSSDLRSWKYESGVEGFFECPELFELPVVGQPQETRWVMYDAHGRYTVGSFDGKEFKTEQSFRQFAYGGGYFYASQTFNGTPGRRIQIGWGRNITHPGMPFNQAMLFPSDLTLKKIEGSYVLCPTPIATIETLHLNSQKIENRIVTAENSAALNVDPGKPLHIIAEFERGNAPITLSLLGYELRYDNEWEFSTIPLAKKESGPAEPAGPFAAPTTAAPTRYVSNGSTLKIEAIIDKNILEFFVNDGELYYVTDFSGDKSTKVEALIKAARTGNQQQAVSREFIVRRLEVHELKSIWNK